MFNIKEMGNRILLSRRDLSLNQDRVAAISGVSRTYISQLERGIPDNVSVDIVFSLAAALGVSPAYLMGLTDNPLGGIDDEENSEEELTLREASAHYIAEDPTTKELLTLIQEMDAGQRLQFLSIAKVLLHPPRIIE